jgi:hypothetical protein
MLQKAVLKNLLPNKKVFMEQHPPSIQNQTVIVGKVKSVGTAFLLAFLFGPLGLLYATVPGGILMFFAGLVLFFILPIVGAFVAWIVCIIWAVVAANHANDRAREQASSLGRN